MARFHVPTDIGEDSLLACSNAGCSYAANIEKADGRVATNSSAAATVSQFYVVQAAVASLVCLVNPSHADSGSDTRHSSKEPHR